MNRRLLLATPLLLLIRQANAATVQRFGYVSNSYQLKPSDPTGTTNASWTMMGLAGAITPKWTGTVEFTIVGSLNNSGTGASANAAIYVGTGSAPANGDALPGSALPQIGGASAYRAAAATAIVPFTLTGVATGLSVATTYWIDLGLYVFSGAGTSTATNITLTAREIP